MGQSASRMTEDDLRFLIEHTNFNRRQIVQWCHSFYKDCPDGRLSKDKFQEVYAEFFPNGDPGEFSDHVFRSFDANRSGYIEFSEFLVAINITSKQSNPMEKLNWAFSLYDTNGNGQIEKSEMLTVVTAIHDLQGSRPRRSDVSPEDKTDVIFARIDTNGDGVISKDEFVAACLKDSVLQQLLTPDDTLK